MSYTVFFDVETGGVQPSHPTTQLAAVVIDDAFGEEAGSFEIKIAFDESAADPEALRINHYTREAWAGASTPSVAAAKFAAFIKPFSSIEMISKRTEKPYNVAKLAGYNALTFDLPRLKTLFDGAFFPCSYQVRDVLQRAMFYFDEHIHEEKPPNLKLSTVCAHFGIAVNGSPHDALTDVRMTIALALRLRG